MKGSLTATADGFTFQLQNKLGSGYAKRMLPLTLDGEPLDMAASTFEIDGQETVFDAVCGDRAVHTRDEQDDDHLLPRLGLSRRAPHKVGMGFEVAGLGELGFDFTDETRRDGLAAQVERAAFHRGHRRIGVHRHAPRTAPPGKAGHRARYGCGRASRETIQHERYTHFQQDMTTPLDEAFAGAEAVVHLAFVLRQLRDRAEGRRTNIGGSESVLRACASAGVGRIVFMSSATVYGPRPDNPHELTEDAPLHPLAGFAYAEDKAACEALFRAFAEQRPEACVSILRGCVVMGPNAANFITAALDKPLLIGVCGDDPAMQFVHEDDLAEVLVRFATEPHPGVYNVAGPRSVRWSKVVSLAGKRLIRLPAPARLWADGTRVARSRAERRSGGRAGLHPVAVDGEHGEAHGRDRLRVQAHLTGGTGRLPHVGARGENA